jgi:hypothetical protein
MAAKLLKLLKNQKSKIAFKSFKNIETKKSDVDNNLSVQKIVHISKS